MDDPLTLGQFIAIVAGGIIGVPIGYYIGNKLADYLL